MGRSILLGLAVGFGLAVVFAAGFVTRDLIGGSPRAQAFADPSASGYPLLMEVQTLLDQHYLREQPDYIQRQHAAIRGMLGALADRYTFFIDPPVAASESDVLAGTYGGIGVEIQRNEAGEIVMTPYADSPAALAGVQVGDILLDVNGTPIELTTQQDAIDQLLRGEVRPGNGAEVTYRRAGLEAPVTVFIEFGVINVPSVIWRVLAEDARVGYVHVLRFTSRTPEELRAAMAELSSAGIGALVLDLRNNAGGLLAESIAVADEFIDAGPLAFERKNDSEQTFDGASGGVGLGYPLVVLVNGGTASGAELLAGAIQDSERGILIGQVTFGKGTIQQIYTLSDSSSLHVTAAEWLTPDRQPLDGRGLQPDITMIPDANGRDVELGEALRYLGAKIDSAES